MDTIDRIRDMQRSADEFRASGRRISFVPTMGALHEGHLDLIRTAADLGNPVVVSVFVNPSQFGKDEDLDRYPRDLQRDAKLAAEAGCDILFTPRAEEMYPDGACTWVEVAGLSSVLEGAFRPTHFRGVTTVVMALLNIVKPHVAVFGQKDAQQAAIVQRMLRDLHVDVELVIHPTRRDADGLAMSSRNMYLTELERFHALAIPRSLRLAEQRYHEGLRDARMLCDIVREELSRGDALAIDYVEVVDPSSLEMLERIADKPSLLALAVRTGTTRLIDNTILK
jgi:pantoate--beta-alanine ligase